jgi:hypothetical protein
MDLYFQKLIDKGMAIYVGEYGKLKAGRTLEPVTRAMMAACQDLRVGRVIWSWFAGDDHQVLDGANINGIKHGWRSWTINPETCGSDNPTANGAIDPETGRVTPTDQAFELTWFGKFAWDDNHREEEQVTYAGYAAQKKIGTASAAPNMLHSGTLRQVRIYALDGRCIAAGTDIDINGVIPSTASYGAFIIEREYASGIVKTETVSLLK